MMDWLNGISLTGIPWWAVFILMLLTFLATKGVDGVLKIWTFIFDREKYYDLQKKVGEDALVSELREQVKTLRTDMALILTELKDTRSAHGKCEIEQAKMQGKLDAQAERMNAMQIQIDQLLRHEKVNVENAVKLAKIVKDETGKAPEIV
jgi:hypothetical protein